MASYKRIFGAVALFVNCSYALAYEDWMTASNYTKVISVSGGVAFTSAGKTQNLYLVKTENTPEQRQISVRNTYQADEKNSTLGTGEVFLALQWPFNEYLLTQLGVAFGGAGEVDLQGKIASNGVPTGSRYEYKVSHGMVGARGKLITAATYAYVQPYITGLIGAGFNHVHGYHTIPQVDTELAPLWFEDNTNSFVFTYALGAGAQKMINPNWNVGLGYEFTAWGKSDLGDAASSMWTGSGPRLSNIYTHSILFAITYLC